MTSFCAKFATMKWKGNTLLGESVVITSARTAINNMPKLKYNLTVRKVTL